MSEMRQVVERELERVDLRPFTLDGFHRRRDRKRRNRRIRAVAAAVVIAVVVDGGLVRAFSRSEAPTIPASSSWTIDFRTWGHDGSAPVVVGPNGVYVAGNTYDPNAPASSNAFVPRYDAAGQRIWTRTADVGRFNSILALAMDHSDVLAAGVSGKQALVLKYANDGTRLWSWSAWTGTNGGSIAGALGVAPTGDGGAFVSGDGKDGVFLLRLDGSGHEIWSTTWRGTFFGRLATAGDAVYITAEGSTIQGRTDSDVNLRRYDGSGQLVWQRTYGTHKDDAPASIAADTTGVYVAGFRGAGAHSDGVDFLRKYAPNGTPIWTVDNVPTAALASDGSVVYLAGFVGPENPGTIVVQARDSSGSLIWSRERSQEVGTGESALGVAGEPFCVFVSGEWGPHAFPGDFVNQPQNRWPGWDAFLTKVDPERAR